MIPVSVIFRKLGGLVCLIIGFFECTNAAYTSKIGRVHGGFNQKWACLHLAIDNIHTTRGQGSPFEFFFDASYETSQTCS